MSSFVAGEASQALFARAQKRMPGGVNSPVRSFRSVGVEPFFVKRAFGSELEDVDGKRYIDFVGTWGPAILGHAPEVVQAAVSEALAQGTSFGTCHEREVEMAEMICAQVPWVEMVRMVNSGTEATMTAIRLARGFTGRSELVKFEGCYHGHVDSLLVAAGSGALTLGEPDSAGVPANLAELTHVLPYNDLAAVEALFAERGEEIACLILEPYPANTGLLLPKVGYLEALRELCTKYGVVLIFDEVMTGFRLAEGGVAQRVGVTPDLVAMGKVIGGGLPVGAFGGKREILQMLAPLGPVYQAGTLSGNPLALAAGMAQLRELKAQNGYAKLEELGAFLEAGLRKILSKHGLPWQLHRAGSMWSLFFNAEAVEDSAGVQAGAHEKFRAWFAASLQRGIYLPPSPYEAIFLSTAHTQAQLEYCLEVWDEELGKLG